MGNPSPSINLLKKSDNFFDRFVAWALTAGRVVVIATETIALLAFIYRFTLDRQLIDLHDIIKRKQHIIELSQNNEQKYRSLQDRLALVANLSPVGLRSPKLFDEIMSLVPTEVTINRIVLTSTSIQLDARAGSSGALGGFIKTLRADPNVEVVSLDKIENRTSDGTIAVVVTINFKKLLN
jgi:Tfp pilus assembly protein PilN